MITVADIDHQIEMLEEKKKKILRVEEFLKSSDAPTFKNIKDSVYHNIDNKSMLWNGSPLKLNTIYTLVKHDEVYTNEPEYNSYDEMISSGDGKLILKVIDENGTPDGNFYAINFTLNSYGTHAPIFDYNIYQVFPQEKTFTDWKSVD